MEHYSIKYRIVTDRIAKMMEETRKSRIVLYRIIWDSQIYDHNSK